MRELTQDEQAREVTLIEGPWPMVSMLPMKNLYTSKIGFLIRRDGVTELTLYDGNFVTMEVMDYADLPKWDFDCIATLVKAGWVGD